MQYLIPQFCKKWSIPDEQCSRQIPSFMSSRRSVRNWKNHCSRQMKLLPVLPNLESVVSMEDKLQEGHVHEFLLHSFILARHICSIIVTLSPHASKVKNSMGQSLGQSLVHIYLNHFFSTNYLSWWTQFWIKHVLPILRHKKIGGWKPRKKTFVIFCDSRKVICRVRTIFESQ